jgi:hypothetical protein
VSAVVSLELVEQLTIPALARKQKIPRRTLFTKLMRLYHQDLADPARDSRWLIRYAHSRPWLVNLPRLRLAHPELFGVPAPEEMYEHLLAVEAYARDTGQKLNALIAGFRKHKAEHEALAARTR